MDRALPPEISELKAMGVDEKAVEVARHRSAPLVVGTTLADCVEAKGSSTSLDDSDCRAAAQTKASKLGMSYADMEDQAKRIATKKREGRNITLVKLQAVDTIVSYDGQCENSKTNKVERDVADAASTAGASDTSGLAEPYDDTLENKCRIALRSELRKNRQ